MLARRMNGGSCSIDSASAACSEPIAVVVVARWSTRPARSSRRSATSVTSLEEATTKRSSSGVSRLSSLNSLLEADSDGLRYSRPSFIAWPWPSYCFCEPLKTACRSLRVSGSNVLKTWSRSTAEVVASWPIMPPSGIFGAPWAGSVRST